MPNRVVCISMTLVFSAILLTSCSRNPQKLKEKYLQSGQMFFDKGEYDRASIQFRKALQLDPRFGEAEYRLGLTDMKLRLWQDAYRALSQAVDLEPRNVGAHMQLAELTLASRELESSRQAI